MVNLAAAPPEPFPTPPRPSLGRAARSSSEKWVRVAKLHSSRGCDLSIAADRTPTSPIADPGWSYFRIPCQSRLSAWRWERADLTRQGQGTRGFGDWDS